MPKLEVDKVSINKVDDNFDKTLKQIDGKFEDTRMKVNKTFKEMSKK